MIIYIPRPPLIHNFISYWSCPCLSSSKGNAHIMIPTASNTNNIWVDIIKLYNISDSVYLYMSARIPREVSCLWYLIMLPESETYSSSLHITHLPATLSWCLFKWTNLFYCSLCSKNLSGEWWILHFQHEALSWLLHCLAMLLQLHHPSGWIWVVKYLI